MKEGVIFIYEWKHFARNPFKVVALVLFMLAAIYGLHNGAALYQVHMAEVEQIKEKVRTAREKTLAYYEEGKSGPENRPWIKVQSPFWAIWYSGIYHFKEPSAAMVYSIGQAEQYGYYKRVSFWASPYDADMAEEIANPERIRSATLDFSFVLLFLLPLLLLVWLYNLQSAEAEQGLLPLVALQVASINRWLLVRLLFYASVALAMLTVLLIYGALLTGVFQSDGSAFASVWLFALLYLAFWTGLYYVILLKGRHILGNTLKMNGLWILLAFIIPGGVQQWVSLSHPSNLMTDFIDAKRDKAENLFKQPDSLIHAQLIALMPELRSTAAMSDEAQAKMALNQSASALANALNKESIAAIEADIQDKNQLIKSFHWLNPLGFAQNRLNAIAHTHFDDYQRYRDEIQTLIDKQIRVMVLDTWNGLEVDKNRFEQYTTELLDLY